CAARGPAARGIAAPPGGAATRDQGTLSALEHCVNPPRSRRPFFAFVHFISTHWPYDPSCELPGTALTPRDRYDRAVRCADRLIARALATVSLTDTILVVTADHGEALCQPGIYGHSAGRTLT